MDDELAADIATAFYRTLLKREPDPGGLRHFVSLLQSGRLPSTIAADFTNSDEFRYWARRYDPSIPAKIEAKWDFDRQHLPLTSEHRELYDIIHRFFWASFADFPDLIDCRDYNDRMQWLKLFDQDRLIISCSDKITAKDYAKEALGEGFLIPTLATASSFDDLSFDALPTSFVIKANHDSGTVVAVKDKTEIEADKVRARLAAALSNTRFGWEGGEWSYRFIPPRLLVEPYLASSHGALDDFKFYCVHGKVKFMHFIYDRSTQAKEQIIDLDGRPTEHRLYPSFPRGDKFSRPDNWDELIWAAERISRPFKFVRADFYNIDGQIKFGELTFWPMAGAYHGDGQKALGPLLDFDRTTFKPSIMRALGR